VVFDLGNVLIGWDPVRAVAAAVGDVEAARFLAAEDFDFAAYNRELDLGRPSAEAEEELARSHPHWHEHARGYRENFDRSLSEIATNVETLRELHAAGVRLFALTNWSAELFPRARDRFDFLELFDDILVSGEERVAKPDPAVFELLRRRMDLPLEDCLFLDDSPANVSAARSAGMDAELVTPGLDLRAALRDRGLPV
jgi:2-haloacid dehalogenase